MYGSDFGDSSDEADADDDMLLSQSESDSLVGDAESESDFSLSSFSSGAQRRGAPRPPSPEPLWLQQRELPPLELPETSDDLLVPLEYALKAAAIYEIMRRFKYLVRLSPFRLEDFCAALLCTDQSPLLTEIHIMLLKAILREEDSQVTHFGPLDQKDSVNISLYLIDHVTWPEVLRSYVESDPGFDRTVLNVLTTNEYPYASIEDRLTVLQFLTDQFLITTSVRDDLLQEGPIHYDDHCRICHRLGDLLCCETCPAVFHLECVDPPMVDVPTEDWQCNICKSHQLSGVYDCISTQEKQGLLCRQDHLGFDRHGRKYWFISRRLFVENEEGTQAWYFSSVEQLNFLLQRMDPEEMELSLYREISDFKDEIVRQMQITETLTNQHKGNKKSYLEIENAKLKEFLEKKSNDNEAALGQDIEEKTEAECEEGKIVENLDGTELDDTKDSKDAMDVDIESDTNDKTPVTNKHSTRLKTGSLTQKSYAEDVKRKNSLSGKEDMEKLIDADIRLTRQKTNQISTGTLIFRLGMENSFKTYVNQFTTNTVALNKPQRNEERDKKRHLSHKFSLTTASEFKWIGTLNGTQANVISTLRQTLMALEQAIASPYMHPNWQSLRKAWVQAVTCCSRPLDFANVFVILLSCFKSPIFANVWHEQLGHVHLQRITSNEREEKKKIEKREKREKDDEEERNRLAVNFVKYSLGLKHQVWKQKGEEYRIHGQWGWIWMSYGRRQHRKLAVVDKMVTHKIMVPVRQADVPKIIAIRPSTFEYFKECKQKLFEGKSTAVPVEFMNVDRLDTIGTFAEIDVCRALTAPGRLLYPKLAKKSKLDELLARRISLRDLEEQKLKQIVRTDQNETVIDEDSKAKSVANSGAAIQTSIEKQLAKIIANKVNVTAPVPKIPNIDMDLVNTLAKNIQAARQQFGQLNRFGKQYKCYTKECNNTNSNVFSLPQASLITCYSSICLQKSRVKRELLMLLRSAHTAGNGCKETVAAIMNVVNKKSSILEQKLTEGKASDLLCAEPKPDDPVKMHKDFKDAVTTSYFYEESDVLECIVNIKAAEEAVVKSEIKVEIKTEPKVEEPIIMAEDVQGVSMMEVEVGANADIKEEPTVKLDDSVDHTPETKRRRLNDSASEVDILSTKDPQEDRRNGAVALSTEAADEEEEDNKSLRPRKSLRNVKSKSSVTTTTTTTSSRTTTEFDDGSIEEESNSSLKTRSRESNSDGRKSDTTISTSLIVSQSKYVMHPNRRFASNTTKAIRKDELMTVKKEFGPNGSERVYTTTSSMGRVYLKKSFVDTQLGLSANATQPIASSKIGSSKYPVINSYVTRNKNRSIMTLPQHELIKLSRSGVKYSVAGFHHLAKPNTSVWPYPCSRPQFKTSWLFRTMNVKTLAAVALQLRIMWCCMRWDDMATKPPNNDGKHQVTTETEIMSLEILKHRHTGRFSEKTQYLRRKVVIPLELPKTIRGKAFSNIFYISKKALS